MMKESSRKRRKGRRRKRRKGRRRRSAGAVGGAEFPHRARLPIHFLLDCAHRLELTLARSQKTRLSRFQRRACPMCVGDILANNVSIVSLEHSCLQHTQMISTTAVRQDLVYQSFSSFFTRVSMKGSSDLTPTRTAKSESNIGNLLQIG